MTGGALLVFVFYTFAIVAIGYWASQKPQKTKHEIHLGNREHGKWTSALSAGASTESGFVLLGMVGMGYTVGVNAYWIVPAGVAGYLLNWLVLGPSLRRKSEALDAVTVPEFLALSTGAGRLGRLTAALATVFALVFLVAYVSAQFSASGKALSSQFGLSYPVAVLVGVALVVIYTAMGGFRAVSWTDNLQAVMMAVALIILPAVVIWHAGGPGNIVVKLGSIDPKLTSLTSGANGWGAVMATLPWLMLGLAYPGQPHAVVRLMAAKDQHVFRPAAIISVVWFIIIYTGAVSLGLAARAAFSGTGNIAADPETILPVLAAEFLPGILAGVTLAAIIAAISSTVDSILLSAASTVVRDVRAVFGLEPLKRELFWMRATILVLTAIAALFAIRESGLIFKLVLYAWTGLGASLGPAILYCALAREPKALATIAGIVVGGVLAFALHGHPLNLLISFIAGLAAVLLLHFALPRPSATGSS